ncbi:MAG: transglycosylase domain-containing protein, partial [Endomicrobium sp.]|nr:transglycosylase domain-containing protein [Endomicrobium sp.]
MKLKKSKKNFSFKKFFVLLFFVAILIVAITRFVIEIIGRLPYVQELENYTPNLSTKIYDRNNNLISEFFVERRVLIPIKEVPVNLQKAFIAIEDNNFFKHWGISIKGTARAFIRMILKRKVAEGGSTITQQLAKTIFLTREKTLLRKIKESILTIQLEKKYSKYEILQFYINQIYFGNGAYGVQAAARIYFNKNTKDLNLAECATLAAIPKSPNYYNPFKNTKASITRRNLVLLKMKKLGYITKEQEKEAIKVTLPIKKKALENSVRYLTDFLKILLEPKYGTNALFKSGL